jgi:hypothetical protein
MMGMLYYDSNDDSVSTDKNTIKLKSFNRKQRTLYRVSGYASRRANRLFYFFANRQPSGIAKSRIDIIEMTCCTAGDAIVIEKNTKLIPPLIHPTFNHKTSVHCYLITH